MSYFVGISALPLQRFIRVPLKILLTIYLVSNNIQIPCKHFLILITMKKVKQSIYTTLSTAKLFLDDLEEIDKILKESWSSYTLTIDEYELESLNEITQIEEKQNFNKLEVRLTEPYFTLNIDEDRTYIYSDNHSLCIGVIERIKPIIKRRKAYFNSSFFFWVFIILNVLLLFSFLLENTFYKGLYSDLIEYIVLGLTILSSIKVVVSSFSKNRKNFTVFTTKKSNKQSNYFTRNTDQIITILISGFIGLITGIFVAWYRFKLTCQ